jgi:hypothetical protein
VTSTCRASTGPVPCDGRERCTKGNGELQPIVDKKATQEQLEALGQALSGQHGDTLMEIVAAVCPNVHEPILADFEFEFDIDSRSGHMKAGDVLETEVETMRNIDPPTPYRVIVRIPNGFEYTGPDESAETAVAKSIRFNGAFTMDLTNSHASMAYVRRGNMVETGAHPHVEAPA